MKAAAPLLLVLLLAFALRLAPLGDNRFLEDEALYAYWGLQIATGVDPMLDEEPVDKPPLFPYAVALSYWVTGELESWDAAGRFTAPGLETQARLPALVASMLSVALVYRLGHLLYADPAVALVAALLVALSPFDIAFASTAFTDPLITVFVLAALVAAGSKHPGAAGALAGLAVATKQQGLLFLPLVVAVGLLPRWRFDRRGWVRFALAFAAVAAAVVAWDLARAQRPGFFEQSVIAYGGLEPARLAALGERAREWVRQLSLMWGVPMLVAWSALLVLWWSGWIRRAEPPNLVDRLLVGFGAVFLVVHWLVAFQVWDRYLLGLVPLVALLVARTLRTLIATVRDAHLRRPAVVATVGIAALFLVPYTLGAVRSVWPAGGDHGAYDGIDELAAYVRTETPPGSVLYHYWLGHHYRFYLHGAPLRLHWYPDPVDLVHDAAVYRREPRYIAFPTFREGTTARLALEGAGVALVPVLETHRRDGSVSFVLYRMDGPDVGTLERGNVRTCQRASRAVHGRAPMMPLRRSCA